MHKLPDTLFKSLLREYRGCYIPVILLALVHPMVVLEKDEPLCRRLQVSGIRQQVFFAEACCLLPDAFPHLRFTLFANRFRSTIPKGIEHHRWAATNSSKETPGM
jgi:hypothetical protein